mmetsp:Transcript_15968/g.17897  ORF Transcript_15968/g.17897 Transcript_15968/m.17897 type:complete len:82 (+) Transcript_15968:199-444(+)
MNFDGCCSAVGGAVVGAGHQDGRNSGCEIGMNAPDAAVAVAAGGGVDEVAVVEEELNHGDCHHRIVADTAVGVVAAADAHS